MLIPFKELISKYKITPTGIFHIGASEGQEAEDYFNNGIENVIWIEAIPNVYETLKQHISKYNKMIAVNACIADMDGVIVKFNIANNGGQSSSILQLGTHKTAHPEVKYTHTITCVTKRADSVIYDLGIDLSNYDFLNIDLQGAELFALHSLGAEIDKVNYAYIEVNKNQLYIGSPLLHDIDSFMKSHGFKRVELIWCGNFGWGDAFYTR